MSGKMRTVQMTLDGALVEAVDVAAARLGTSRSEFAREALRRELRRRRELAAEQRQRGGYRKYPVKKGEFDRWEREQVWPE